MSKDKVNRILKVYKKPFTYDEYGGAIIWDANHNHVLDIRGWGSLQKLPDGAEIQDNLGKLITEFLNKLEP